MHCERILVSTKPQHVTAAVESQGEPSTALLHSADCIAVISIDRLRVRSEDEEEEGNCSEESGERTAGGQCGFIGRGMQRRKRMTLPLRRVHSSERQERHEKIDQETGWKGELYMYCLKTDLLRGKLYVTPLIAQEKKQRRCREYYRRTVSWSWQRALT